MNEHNNLKIEKIDEDSFNTIKDLRDDIKDESQFFERIIKIKEKTDECYAVMFEDKAIAEVTVTLKSSDATVAKEGLRIYISGLYVKKAYRNRNIATYLISYIVDTFTNYGYKEITVLVDRTNTAAVNLYKKMGFINERTYKEDDWIFDLLILKMKNTTK
jgi:ribosomal protein S18 acetylase RimI-like enzyme